MYSHNITTSPTWPYTRSLMCSAAILFGRSPFRPLIVRPNNKMGCFPWSVRSECSPPVLFYSYTISLLLHSPKYTANPPELYSLESTYSVSSGSSCMRVLSRVSSNNGSSRWLTVHSKACSGQKPRFSQ